MNHFFSYLRGNVNLDRIFYDSDYVEHNGDETDNSFEDETTIATATTPELVEASRFINGENIACEEGYFNGWYKGGIHYVAYLHTRRKIDTDKFRKIINQEIKQRMGEGGYTYRLSVERDSSTYSKANTEYVVKIET